MDQIWWTRVPNAMAFIHDITDYLLAEKSVLIQSIQDIPWHATMVAQIKEAVSVQNSLKSFENIRKVLEPGPFLLKSFCKPEKRSAYRPTKSFARFFADSDDIVLHSRYLWVCIESKDELEKWVAFVSEYYKERGKNKETAVFVLDWQGERIKTAKKGIQVFSFDDYINEYDRMVFSMIAASMIREDVVVKNYLAELASHIAVNDIEFLAACLDKNQDFIKDPYNTINDIVKNCCRSDGKSFGYIGTIEKVKHCIWLAQIKTIYPLLESYRGAFIEKHKSDIAKELPISSTYGEFYNDPQEVELGTLVFMADNRRIQISSNEYYKLKKYKDARNSLSHLNVLTLEGIRALL